MYTQPPKSNNNRAVAIIASRRADYLYITLDALFNATNADLWDVHVYIDGCSDGILRGDVRKAMANTMGEFPVSSIVYRPRTMGVLWHLLYAVEDTFSHGYDEVLFLEEDNLIAIGALEYLRHVERDDFFYGLMRRQPAGTHIHSTGTLYPQGVMIEREKFSFLNGLVKHTNIEELPWPPDPNTKLSDIENLPMINYDGVIQALAIEYHLPFLIPSRSYSEHIGISGAFHAELPEEALELERNIFSHSREEWRLQFARTLEQGDYSASVAERLFPKGFQYE